MSCAMKYDYPLRARFFKGSGVIHAARAVGRYRSIEHHKVAEFIGIPCQAADYVDGGNMLILKGRHDITCKMCQSILFPEHEPVEKRFVVRYKETGEYYKRSNCDEEGTTPSLADATMWRTKEGPLNAFGQIEYYDDGCKITKREYQHISWNRRASISQRSKLYKEIIPQDNIEIKPVSFRLGN